MEKNNRLILVVDDEDEGLNSRISLLQNLGYQCIGASGGKEALDLVRQRKPLVVLTDLVMPHMDGIQMMKQMKREEPDMVVVIYTGFGSIPSAVKAIIEGAFDYIPKPFSSEQLKIVLERAIKYAELARENNSLRSQIEAPPRHGKVIGTSEPIKRIMENVHKVARTNANVMVTGESGTGKELIAKSIHYYSGRSDYPFVPVDCVALPENLLESELFGYEKGAFTGAAATKQGLIEIANGGTLFLDEIAELSFNLQAKLLRVLQELQFRRIGGKKIIEVDIRIISATNTEPEEAVRTRKLREDLFYRLNVIHMKVPSLREREEDIPLLAYHFLREFSKSNQIEIDKFSHEVLACLKKYSWPGNVRELQNVVEHAVSMATSNIIEPKDLPDKFRDKGGVPIHTAPMDVPFKEARKQVVERFEKDYLKRLIKEYNGNISNVAKAAGLNRKTIYRMMEFYNLNRGSFAAMGVEATN